jgi:hypothetical protein
MKWRIKDGFNKRKCWIALPPASNVLRSAIEQIEILLVERNRDVFDGEITAPACSYDATMFGCSVDDAQPTVIFSSSSDICRRNAKNIIAGQEIHVDPRGVGMEYYRIGPQLFAGTAPLDSGGTNDAENLSSKLVFDRESSRGSSERSQKSAVRISSIHSAAEIPVNRLSVNGQLAFVGSLSLTIGGIVAIDDQLFALTVAHAFEGHEGESTKKKLFSR